MSPINNLWGRHAGLVNTNYYGMYIRIYVNQLMNNGCGLVAES